MLIPFPQPDRHRPDGPAPPRHVTLEFVIVGLGLGLALILLTLLEYWGRPHVVTAERSTSTLAQRVDMGKKDPTMQPADP